VVPRGGTARLVCISSPTRDAGKQPRFADLGKSCAIVASGEKVAAARGVSVN